MPQTQTDRLDGITTSAFGKVCVKAVATGNIPFIGAAPYGYQTIDGVLCTDNTTSGPPNVPPDRVLLIGQADQTQNGIWQVSALAWTRSLDFDGARDAVNGSLVYSLASANGGGATQGNTLWVLKATNPVIFGTTPLVFEVFVIGAGAGITFEFALLSKANGAGSAIGAGVYDDVPYIPFACTILGYAIQADQVGSVSLDIWKKPFAAGSPPVVGNSICAGLYPGLSAAQSVESTTLTGWTTAIAAGDAVRFNVRSAATITRFTLLLILQRTVIFE